MRHGGNPCLRVPQTLCSSPPQDFLPPPQGDPQATRRKVLLWQSPQGLSLGALSSFHPTPSGRPFPELQDQCLFPDEGTAGLVFGRLAVFPPIPEAKSTSISHTRTEFWTQTLPAASNRENQTKRGLLCSWDKDESHSEGTPGAFTGLQLCQVL